ncbi:hypothetical protein PT974_12493 [Cladobotryum mycophilum]|uniref:Uncharacterized protein n=1 Tax=Cladobotryum mycophilum TaxID=491253 RepID=A0ABR0S863_9HYPO
MAINDVVLHITGQVDFSKIDNYLNHATQNLMALPSIPPVYHFKATNEVIEAIKERYGSAVSLTIQ